MTSAAKDSLVIALDDMGLGESMEIRHVYPIDELEDHIIDSADCPCGPKLEMGNGTIIVIHNPWDRTSRIEFYHGIHGEVVL